MAVLVLLIGGVGTGVYLTQNRQQSTTQATLSQIDLKFQPDKLEVAPGAEFNIDVFANASDNQITNVDLAIKYDPEILVLKSITPGQFLPKILTPPQIASGSATVSLGTDGNAGVSGSGTIAGLKFQANARIIQTSGQITFDPQNTKISILNRSPENTSDNLGSAEISIKTAAAGHDNNQASSSGNIQSSPSPRVEAANPVASSSAQTFDPADFNEDGLINSVDLSLMYSGWGKPETDAQKKADLNKDGVINGVDYAMLLTKFKAWEGTLACCKLWANII